MQFIVVFHSTLHLFVMFCLLLIGLHCQLIKKNATYFPLQRHNVICWWEHSKCEGLVSVELHITTLWCVSIQHITQEKRSIPTKGWNLEQRNNTSIPAVAWKTKLNVSTVIKTLITAACSDTIRPSLLVTVRWTDAAQWPLFNDTDQAAYGGMHRFAKAAAQIGPQSRDCPDSSELPPYSSALIIRQRKWETPTPEETVTAHKVTLLWLRATRLDAGFCSVWAFGLLHTKSLHKHWVHLECGV